MNPRALVGPMTRGMFIGIDYYSYNVGHTGKVVAMFKRGNPDIQEWIVVKHDDPVRMLITIWSSEHIDISLVEFLSKSLGVDIKQENGNAL